MSDVPNHGTAAVAADRMMTPFTAGIIVHGVGRFDPQPDVTTYELALLTQFFVSIVGVRGALSMYRESAFADWIKCRPGLARHFQAVETQSSG